jgi:hypothetical protein
MTNLRQMVRVFVFDKLTVDFLLPAFSQTGRAIASQTGTGDHSRASSLEYMGSLLA